MLVGDLVYNDDFDVNCNVAIYRGVWNNGGDLLWSTRQNGFRKWPLSLLDKKIGYITLDVEKNEIVIEIEEEN